MLPRCRSEFAERHVGDRNVVSVMSNRPHVLWIALLGTITWGSVMYWEAGGFKTDCTPGRVLKTILSNGACTIASPVAELELARDPSRFRAIIDQRDSTNDEPSNYARWNIEVIRVNTCMDCLFIALYWSTFVLFASQYPDWLSRAVVIAISAAAVCDVVENIRLFQSLDAIRSGTLPTHMPGGISALKWVLFGLAKGLLGVVLAKTRRRWDLVLSTFFLASGILTWAGATRVPILGLSILLLSAGLLLAIVRFFPIHPLRCSRLLEWIEYFYLIRFQVLAALLLSLIIPVCYFAAPSIFIGLFDARGQTSFTLIIWMAVQLAWTVMITSRLILVYGPDRFVGIRGLRSPAAQQRPVEERGVFERRLGDLTYSQMGLFGLLAAPCVVMLCCGTDLAWYQKIIGSGIGIALALGILFVTAALHYSIERWDGAWTAARVFPSFGFLKWREDYSRSKVWRLLDSIFERLPEKLRSGLLSGGQVRSGHEVAALSLLLELVVYVAMGFALRPDKRLPEHQPAALFFALFLLMLLTWLLSGAAFFLDPIRLPVLSTLLVLSILSGAIGWTDHQFKIREARPDGVDVSPIHVVHQWERARQKAPTAPVIVVATAGGGIRAAAWTTQVLTGLENESRIRSCPVNLSSSLLAISSVSGGSVGSMFFVAAYDSKTGAFSSDADALKSIRFNASRSTLSAVGWGLLYPDAARTLPFWGMFIPQHIDRGWALENAWISGWRDPPNVSNWRRDVSCGRKPAAIFNATAAENGQRFLIASTDLEETVLSDANGKLEDKETIQFSKNFVGYDVPVVTAARLSATFPYVSAEAQASDGPKKFRVHVGDGGYYDNSGVLSALEWLEEASPALHRHPVLLLLIDTQPGAPETGKRWSWQRQMISPLDTLMNVRTASQQLRSNIELGIGTRQLRSRPDPAIDVATISFLFATAMPTPLSWHLTPEQQETIASSWSKSSRPMNDVMSFLGCRH